MAKGKEQRTKTVKETNTFDINKFIPEKYQTVSALAVILLIFLIYFSPLYFGGKTFESGDIITAHSATTYVEKDRDGYTLWNPYIFCGMPAYVIAVDYKWFNMIYVGITTLRTVFSSLFEVEYAMWTFYLIMLAFSSFLLLKHLTKNMLLRKIFLRLFPLASVRLLPARYAKKPGISGKTQGAKKETKPAKKANVIVVAVILKIIIL